MTSGARTREGEEPIEGTPVKGLFLWTPGGSHWGPSERPPRTHLRTAGWQEAGVSMPRPPGLVEGHL